MGYNGFNIRLDGLENRINDLENKVFSIEERMLTPGILLGWIIGACIIIAWGDKIWNFIKSVFYFFSGIIFQVWQGFDYSGEGVALFGIILSMVLSVVLIISIIGLILYGFVILYIKISNLW